MLDLIVRRGVRRLLVLIALIALSASAAAAHPASWCALRQVDGQPQIYGFRLNPLRALTLLPAFRRKRRHGVRRLHVRTAQRRQGRLYVINSGTTR
jgi:hypothetical protein